MSTSLIVPFCHYFWSMVLMTTDRPSKEVERSYLPAMLILAMLASMAIFASIPVSAESQELGDPNMPLFLVGGSALSPTTPDGDTDDSASFRPGVGINTVDVGIWRSRPLESDLEIEGKVDVSIWARGTGIQSSCFFGILYGVDDQWVGDTIHTQETALSGTAKEFIGEDVTSFNLTKGQSITVLIRVHERGSGGELVFGSVSHPSQVVFTATPVKTSTWAESHKAGKSVQAMTWVDDVWGVEDIDRVEQYIVGPYDSRQMDIDAGQIPEDKIITRASTTDQVTMDVSTSSMNISWTWSYDGWRFAGEDVEPGIYYLVGKVHCTGGRVFTDTRAVVIPEPAPGLLEGPGGTILAALVIGAAAVAIYFYALRTERIYTARGRTVATALMVSVIVLSGMYVFVTAIPMSGPSGGEDAPDFTVTSIDGKTFSLSDQRGKVVFLNLFATWCPGCNAEMPTLVKLRQRYPDAEFITISVEGSGDTDEDIKAFKEKYGAQWTFARDTDRVWQRFQDLGQPYIPTNIIINPQGKLTYRKIGERPFKELSEQMDKAASGGIDISITTQDTSLIVVAFVTGVLSFFAPCAFPLLPGYMGFVLTRKEGVKDRPGMRGHVGGGVAAAIGIIAVFSLAGLLVAAAGSAVVAYVSYLAPFIAVIIAVMGLLMLLDRTSWTERLITPMTSKVQTRLSGSSRLSPNTSGLFLYGAGYGVASMGCQAPVFVAIMVAGFVAGGFGNAFLLFIMFGIGMGIMMVLVTVLIGMAKGAVIKKMTSAMPMIKRVSGLILLLAGIYLAWYYLTILTGQ